MNYVSFDVLQVENQSVKSHWYRHEEGIDIYYFQKEDGHFLKVHISFFGQVIEWNPLDGTRTGLVVEQEQGTEVVETVHYDARTNDQSIAQSLVIIDNASCISAKLREELREILALGPGVVRKRKSSTSFWKQLFSFFRFK